MEHLLTGEVTGERLNDKWVVNHQQFRELCSFRAVMRITSACAY